MSIQLREAMEIFPFSEAKLLTGPNGLDRQVTSANIQEVPDVDTWMQGGEILFSSGYAFRTPERGVQLVEALNKKEVAALALRPGPVLQQIPEAMIACGKRLAFPIFELPGHLPYMDCIIPIFEVLTQKRLYVLERIEVVHNLLTQAMIDNKGLEGLCAIIQRVSKRRAAILSPQGIIIVTGGQNEQDELYWEKIQEEYRLLIRQNRLTRLKPNKCNLVQIGPNSMISIPIYAKDELIAFLSVESGPEMQSSDMLAFENASSLIAIELLKERAVLAQQQKVQEQLLEDLVFSRYQDEKNIIKRGKFVGFDLTSNIFIFVLGADSFDDHLNSNGYISERKVQKMKESMTDLLRENMSSYPHPFLLLGNGFHVIGMSTAFDDQDIESCKNILSMTVTQLIGQYTPLLFSAGIGRIKNSVADVPKSYQEARQARKSGRKIAGNQLSGRVGCFQELGCMCFLSELSGSAVMQEFCDEYVGKLIEYDKKNLSRLVDTLAQYFACGANVRETAEKMFLHKNTVIYRLEKIEAVTGKSLHSSQDVFNFQLCLKLQEIV